MENDRLAALPAHTCTTTIPAARPVSTPAPHGPPWAATPYRTAPGWSPPLVGVRPKARARPFQLVEIAATLGVAAAVDLGTWTRGELAPGGFGLALVLAAIPALLFVAARRRRPSVRLGAIAALLAIVAARCVYEPTPAVVLSGLGLVAMFALALRARASFVPEALLSALAAVPKLPSRVRAAVAGLERLASRVRVGRVSVLPIVIPAGLVAAFVGLFALANPIVAKLVGDGFRLVGDLVVLPPIGRVACWIATAIAACALLRPTCRLATGSEDAARSGEAAPTALLVARNGLVATNLLFLAYNALDARYLWSGSPPAGMTTQQYAHQGAFWLTVALATLTAVIGVMFRGALAWDPRARVHRALAWAWMAQGLVLGIGTYRRIAIHIARSGLSDLRIVGVLGTTLVVCGVVLVAVKLRYEKTFTWLLRRMLDAFALTAVLYAVTPTHLVSARVNVARVGRGEYRPLLHAFRQSHEAESAAALLPLLEHPDARVRQGVAALLADERSLLRRRVAGHASWREHDLASSRALAALEGASGRIEAALGEADPLEARYTLLRISKVANEDGTLEEILSIPAASGATRRSR